MPFSTVVILVIWIVRALMAHLDAPPVEADPKRRAKQRMLGDFSLDSLVVYFMPFFPFLNWDRAFLRAFLRPLVGNEQLLRQLESWAQPESPLTVAVEAVHYWLPKRGRRELEQMQLPANCVNIHDYMSALIRYLFEKYPVGLSANYSWFAYKSLHRLFKHHLEHPADALALYFYLTDGGGIAKVPFLNWKPGRGAAKYFDESPNIRSVDRAFWYAVYRAEGMSQPDAETASQECPVQFDQMEFWRDVARLYLRAPESERSPMQFTMVFRQLEWLKFGVPNDLFLGSEQAAALYGSEPDFSLKGRSWASLQRCLNEKLSILEFNPPEGFLPRYTFADDGQLYEIRFIGNRVALYEEGEALSHCVGDGSYYDAARSGESGFWSFRMLQSGGGFKRLLTVQVTGAYIEAALGLANREATPEEYALLERWLSSAAKARECEVADV